MIYLYIAAEFSLFLKTSLSYPQQEDHELDTLLGMKSLLTQKKPTLINQC